jgi:hypothetical protein
MPAPTTLDQTTLARLAAVPQKDVNEAVRQIMSLSRRARFTKQLALAEALDIAVNVLSSR